MTTLRKFLFSCSILQPDTCTGRFPQVSNITFSFDCSRQEGSRITSASIGDEPIDIEKKYVLVTRGYMARGKGKQLRTLTACNTSVLSRD